MKRRFSRLTPLFLAGAMFITGCTDYEDDIQDLNNRFDEFSASTLASLKDQAGVLDNLKSTLQQAQDDIAQNAEECRQQVEQLKQADQTLRSAMDAADNQLRQALQQAQSELEQAMEQADNELRTAIETGDAATLAAAKQDAQANLEAAKTELETKINGVQTTLQDKIDKVNETIETLATKEELKAEVAALNQRIDKEVEDLNATIETAVEELKGMIAALDAKKLDKSVFEEYQTEVTNKFIQVETEITNLGVRLTAEIARVEADFNGKIAALENRMTSAEAALKRIEGETIPAIEQQITDLETQIAKNASDLAAYKELTDKSISLLQVAVSDLNDGLATVNSRVDLLNETLEKYYREIKAALDDRVLVSAFEEYKQNVEVQMRDIKADYEARIAALKTALEGKITDCEKTMLELNAVLQKNLEGKVADLKKLIEESEARSKDAIALAKSELEQKISALESRVTEAEKSIKELQKATAELQQGLKDAMASITEITKAGGTIDQHVSAAVKSTLEEVDKRIQAAIANLKAYVDEVKIDVDDLLGRIQSVVYVPDYNDGKITIGYAKLNDVVIEGQSTVVYKVLPESETNTTLLAEAWKSDHNILDFAVEDVLTRAPEDPVDPKKFEITDVKAEGSLLTLTVATRGLGDEFYKGTTSYSIALLVKYGNNVRSTEYANCIAGTPKTIELCILNGEKDITDQDEVDTYEIQYTDTGVEYAEKVLEGHYPAFKMGDETFTLEEMTAKGYDIELVSEIEYTVSKAEGGHDNVFVNDPAEAGEIELGTIASVSLDPETTTLDDVNAKETVKYSYTACEKTVYASADVVITKVTPKHELEDVDIYWNYNLDAEQDAATESKIYKRETLAAAVVNSTLPEDTTWADLLETEPTITVKVNGVVDENVTVKFKDANEAGNPTFDISKFEWGKTYKVEAVYELENADVTASVTINTHDRAREAITIDLGTTEWDFKRDLEIAVGEIGDDLNVVYERINGPREEEGQAFTVLSETNDEENIDVKEFLTDVFVTHKPKVTKNTTNGTHRAESMKSQLNVVVNDEKQVASPDYTYKSEGITIDESGNLKYVKTFELWYGQELTLEKTIHFVLPRYDYQHSPYFVGNDDGVYFSTVNPSYKDGEGNAIADKMSSEVASYDVEEVNMEQAFDIIDLETHELVDPEAFEEFGLVRVFEIETPEAQRQGTITMEGNKINYHGAAPYVDVIGKLYIQNTDGTRVELPTSFADGNAYANYQVRKFVPLKPMVGKMVEREVDNAKEYTINVLEGIEWLDVRGYGLITDGKFTVGNGTDNGFASGKDVQEVYGLTIEYDALQSINKLAPNIKQFVSWDEGNLTLKFNYDGLMDLQSPIELDVTVTIKYVWGPEDSATVHCVFKKAE